MIGAKPRGIVVGGSGAAGRVRHVDSRTKYRSKRVEDVRRMGTRKETDIEPAQAASSVAQDWYMLG